MRSIRFVILLYGLLFLIPCPSFSQNILTVKSSRESVPAGKYISVCNDPEGHLTIRDLLDKNQSQHFTRINSDVPVFADLNTYVWAKFNINNKTGKDLWLDIKNPATDTIKFYAVSDNQIIAAKLSGDKVPFRSRDIKSDHIFFKINNRPHQQTIYLRLNIRLPRQFPVAIAAADGFIEQESETFFLNGLFYGFLTLIVLYNLFVWFMVKDNSYLFYVVYIIFSGIVLLHFDGITYAYIWPDYPGINDYPAVISSLSMLAAVLFVSRFLNLRETCPALLKGLKVLSAGLVVVCFISLAGFKFFALTISQVLAFTASLYFLFVGIQLYKKGYKPAKYFIASWGALIAGVLVFLAKDMAWIPYNDFTASALKSGMSAEAVLMAFALADRINFYKAEQERTEAEKLKVEEDLRNAESALLQYTANLRKKNELILKFMQEMYELKTQLMHTELDKERSEYLEKLMQSIILTEEDWIEFRKLFDKVHKGYIFRLKEKYTNLTETDIRLLSLMKLQLSQNEMASMLGVTTEAVRKAKQRLRKKISLGEDENIEGLVASV